MTLWCEHRGPKKNGISSNMFFKLWDLFLRERTFGFILELLQHWTGRVMKNVLLLVKQFVM